MNAPTDVPAVRDGQPPTTPADTDRDTEVAEREAYVRVSIDPSEPVAVWLAIVEVPSRQGCRRGEALHGGPRTAAW
ncbi:MULTISPECIES: hypothetical protein [unclassified Nonomuraea]|uniref:hypothetical protein n=1 Tax=unclassified Nonomuraea TaxID=2593643 RepID=UPI0033E3429E